MRKIVCHMVDDELHRHMNGWLAGAGAFLEGRVTYELMEDFWPTADEDPAAAPTIVEFAQIWRDMPKIVYSRTLERTGRNATVVQHVVRAEVVALKAQPGGYLRTDHRAGVTAQNTIAYLGSSPWQPLIIGNLRSAPG